MVSHLSLPPSLGDPWSLTYPPIQPWRPMVSHLSPHLALGPMVSHLSPPFLALVSHGHSPIPPPSLGDPWSLRNPLTQPWRPMVSHLSPHLALGPMVSHLSPPFLALVSHGHSPIPPPSLGDPWSLRNPLTQPWRPMVSHLSPHLALGPMVSHLSPPFLALVSHGHSPIPPPSLGDPWSLRNPLTQPWRPMVSHLSPHLALGPMASHLSPPFLALVSHGHSPIPPPSLGDPWSLRNPPASLGDLWSLTYPPPSLGDPWSLTFPLPT